MGVTLRLVHPQSGLLAFEEAAQIPGAFDLAESVVAELLAARPGIARGLSRYAPPREVDRYLCRWALRDVGDLSALVQLAAESEFAGATVVVPRDWPADPLVARIAGIARERLVLPRGLDEPLERLDLHELEARARERARIAVRALRALVRLWAEWLGRLRPGPPPRSRRPLLIRTYATDWGVDQGGLPRLRNVDFVIGGPIGSGDGAFWAEEGTSMERIEALATRGYDVVQAAGVTVGPAAFLTRVLPGLLRATALFLRLAFAEGWWLMPVRTLVADSLLWREVVHRHSPRAFLFYNDVHPAGMARTLALRREGVLTVQYQHANSWAFDQNGWVPDFINAFSVVGAVATWGPEHTDTFRRHRGVIDDVWEVGCLWSEHARRVREEPDLRAAYRSELGRGLEHSLDGFDRIVGVFDTSVAPLLLRREDMLAFYEGISQLVERFPRVLFVCKPKRPFDELFAEGGPATDVRSALVSAPNVIVVNDLFETAAVIGLSDLSVNACYTSPAVETIGAGCPAVHFDPTDRFPDAFLRRIPRFVATTVDELARLVADQLDATDEVLDRDLAARFAELEGHRDGLAITRLRQRLETVLRR